MWDAKRAASKDKVHLKIFDGFIWLDAACFAAKLDAY